MISGIQESAIDLALDSVEPRPSGVTINALLPSSDGGGSALPDIGFSADIWMRPGPENEYDMYSGVIRPPSTIPRWNETADAYWDLTDFYNNAQLNAIPPSDYKMDYTCLPDDLYTEYTPETVADLQDDYEANCRWSQRASATVQSIDLSTNPPTAVYITVGNWGSAPGGYLFSVWELATHTGDNTSSATLGTATYTGGYELGYNESYEDGATYPVFETAYAWIPVGVYGTTAGADAYNLTTDAQSRFASFDNSSGTDDLRVRDVAYHPASDRYLVVVEIGSPTGKVVGIWRDNLTTQFTRTYATTSGNWAFDFSFTPLGDRPIRLWLVGDDGTTLCGLDNGSGGLELVLFDDEGTVLDTASSQSDTHLYGLTALKNTGTELVAYAYLGPSPGLHTSGVASWYVMPADLADWGNVDNWTPVISGIEPLSTPSGVDEEYQFPILGDYEGLGDNLPTYVYSFPGLYNSTIPVFTVLTKAAGVDMPALVITQPTYIPAGTGCLNLPSNRAYEAHVGTVSTWSYEITNPVSDLGGFGIMFCDSDFLAHPGEGTAGAGLFISMADGWRICINDSCETLTHPGFIPSHIAIRVEVIDSANISMTWWADSTLIATRTVPYTCNKWVPVLTSCSTVPSYRINDTELRNYPGIEYYIDCDGTGCDIWRMVLSGPMTFYNKATDEAEITTPLYIYSEVQDVDGDTYIVFDPTEFYSTVLEQLDIASSCVEFAGFAIDPVDEAASALILYSEEPTSSETDAESDVALVSDIVDIDAEIAEYLESGFAPVFEESYTDTVTIELPIPPDATDMPIYCMNMETGGMSRYTGLEARALATHNGSTVLAQADNIYLNSGVTDAGDPIVGVIGTGSMDLGTDHDKHCHRLNVLGLPACVITIKTTTSENGTPVEREYTLAAGAGTDMRTRFKNLGRGAKSPYWAFQLAATAGGIMDLRSIQPLTGATRRLR